MKANAKVILGIKDATDAQIETAEKSIAEKAKLFVQKHPKANNWNQAVNGKFLLTLLEGEKEPVGRAVIAHNLGNSSAVRQWLIRESIIKPVDAFGEF